MRLIRPTAGCVCRARLQFQAPRDDDACCRAYSSLISPGENPKFPVKYSKSKVKIKPGSCLLRDSVPKEGPLAAYAQLVREGKIREDEHQVSTLAMLQEVIFCLRAFAIRAYRKV